MRVDRDRQMTKAALLAGLAAPAIDPEKRAAFIAAQVAPAIASAIAEELAQIRDARSPRERDERELMEACRAVGAAVDRLEQTKFTAAERAARQSLERAAVKLRRAIARKDAR